eukprot:CAMPEP_0170197896 /NCGR_PEP_ID=MMETSP0040_2-20121228/67497_1 /TAXON_ID=641309 /ORGANISM="Lotharella oceanica, Strain CCMP622" /LENGTH=58 /DNA_ID=CAMNT_0010447689 /DNA_START=582 /DNA_END=755 /DNA_ORIENTATION=+
MQAYKAYVCAPNPLETPLPSSHNKRSVGEGGACTAGIACRVAMMQQRVLQTPRAATPK